MNRLFQVNVNIIPEVEAKKFIKKLQAVGFIRKNKTYIYNYMNKKDTIKSHNGVAIAFSHIKKCYVEFVIQKGWSERKYADITFIIVKDEKPFLSNVYSDYGNDYDNKRLNDEILRERDKYTRRSDG